jgi:predicted ABC-type exoprotein transport system permease subunit
MRTNYALSKTNLFRLGVYIIPPVVISILFFKLSQNEISIVQCLLALILLLIPWSAYLRWKLHKEPGLPIFAIISFMYWIYFALSLFWGPRTLSGNENPREPRVPEEAVTAALELAVIGMLAISLGMRARL